MDEKDEKEILSEEIESRENRFDFKKHLSIKPLAFIFFLLFFANIIYLDLILLQGQNKQIVIQPSPSGSPTPSDVCPSSCLSEIRQIQASVKPSAAPTSAPVNNSQSQVSNSSQTKEYYVPFGSGSGSSADWQDVPGLQANVNSASYGSIKSVVFEASLHVPTGNETAGVRLYNATDNHPVWNSEVDFKGDTNSVFSTSQAITLDSGNKLYKVQMKTQLQYPAVIDQSRLHITTQ